MPLRLLTATLADLDRLCALINSAYRGETSRLGWTTEADLVGGARTDTQELGALLRKPGHVFLLLEDAQQALAGCIAIDRKADRVYLGMITVDPHRQASGIGRQLLTEAERYIAQHYGKEGKETLAEMTVIQKRPELIAWYERRGYHPTGERRPFPYDHPSVSATTDPDLEFVVLEKRIGAS